MCELRVAAYYGAYVPSLLFQPFRNPAGRRPLAAVIAGRARCTVQRAAVAGTCCCDTCRIAAGSRDGDTLSNSRHVGEPWRAIHRPSDEGTSWVAAQLTRLQPQQRQQVARTKSTRHRKACPMPTLRGRGGPALPCADCKLKNFCLARGNLQVPAATAWRR